MIISEATAVHDRRQVTWVQSRDILYSDGRRQTINRTCPQALTTSQAQTFG